jgi:hypothetical protein
MIDVAAQVVRPKQLSKIWELGDDETPSRQGGEKHVDWRIVLLRKVKTLRGLVLS